MRTLLAAILGIALLAPLAASAANPKAGAACKKPGVTSTYNGKEYTCVKSGKKLVWNNGVKIKIPNLTLPAIPDSPIPEVSKINDLTYSVTIPTTTGFDPSSMLLKIFFTAGAGTCKKGEHAVTTLPYSVLCSNLSPDNVFAVYTSMQAISGKSVGNYNSSAPVAVLVQTPKPTSTPSPTPKPTPSPTPTANPFAAAADKAAAAASADKAARITCPVNGKCEIGNKGPGGGIVFYVAPTPQSWGQYLEVAPATWNGRNTHSWDSWCDVSDDSLGSKVTDPELKELIGDEIGNGRGNTQLMTAYCKSGAGNLASAYRGGGKSDWFLPSKDELDQLCQYARGQKQSVSSCNRTGKLKADFAFPAVVYWSSSESTTQSAWSQDFRDGLPHSYYRSTTSYVRPVRAFS